MGVGALTLCLEEQPPHYSTAAPFSIRGVFGDFLGIDFLSPRRQLKVWNTIASGHLFGWFINEAVQT